MSRSIAFLGLAFASTAFAQSPAPSLEEVVVTASRTQERLAAAIPFTTLITSEQIRESGAPDLPALLSMQSGLQVIRNGGAGLTGGLFLRGASSNQVLLLVDGVPQTKQDATGNLTLEHFALDQIERIEIVRGNVSAMYGSGAIGGVVQIFTRQGKAGVFPMASLSVGSQGTRVASASVSGLLHGIDFSLALSGKKTDGISAMNTQQNPTANPDKDGYENRSVLARLGYAFNAQHRVGVSFRRNDGRFSFDSSFDTPNDLHSGKTVLKQTRVDSTNQWLSNWKSQLSYAAQSERSDNSYGGAFAFNDRYTTNTKLFLWDNQIEIAKGLNAKAGIEMQQQGLDADDGFGSIYNPRRITRAFFAGLNAASEQGLQWQANIRSDSFELDTASTGKSNDRETTGLLGLAWQVNPQWRASAMISNAYNLAPLGYLYGPFFGNPKLQPEKATSAELGVQWRTAPVTVNLRAFNTRLRDQLEYNLNTNVFENISRTENRGAELNAQGKVAALALRASLTAQNPQDETNQRRLNRRAKQLANVGANYAISGFNLGADLQYTGSRPDYAVNKELGGYSVAHFTGSYAFGAGFSLRASLRNAFDKKYQTASGFNAEPRSAIIGVEYRPFK